MIKEKRVLIGENVSDYKETRELLSIHIHPSGLASFWQRCGLTADYGASFLSFCFPRESAIKNSLSTILNEIVENAVKYSEYIEDEEVCIRISILHNSNGNLVFDVRNPLSKEKMLAFRKFIEELQTANIQQRYFQQLVSCSENESGSAGLGILTILHDFESEMAFIFFEPGSNNHHTVSVQVKVNIEGLLQ